MLKNIFKRRRSSKKERPSISSPQPIVPQSKSEPTVIEATVEPTVAISSSIGTQAEFSPIRAHPSLLSSPTPDHTAVVPDDEDDPGYSTVRDALTNVSPSKHISDRRNKVVQPPPLPPKREEEEEEILTDLTESDNEQQDVLVQTNERPREEESTPIYAKVKKKNKQPHEHHKKEVSFKTHPPHESTALNHDASSSEGSEVDTIERSSSLPSHRPPIDPAIATRSTRTQSLNLQTLNLANLPVYNFNQTVPLASGDQAYLLTRIGPDGKEETFTATVITPSSPSPQKEKSSSIPTLSTPPSLPPPLTTSTPLTRAHSLQQGVNTIHPNMIPNLTGPPPSNWVRKTKPVPFPDLSTKASKSTQTNTDQSLDGELIKESLAQMTAELSTYSLNESETDLSMDGVTVEQLIQEIPGRLQNALKTLNETLSAKESQLQSYQNEVTKLKSECKELTKANQRLTKVCKDQEELNKHEKTHLEHSLSAVEKEKESLTMETQSLKDKLKQFKNRHKTKVKELTEDLNRLSKERDTFRRDLLEVQSSHIATQSLIERHSSSRPTTAAHHSSTAITIPLEEHKKTLQEFESLLQDVVKTSKSNQKLNSLKKENLSLVSQLNSMEEQCTALRREQRDYQERLLKLQGDLQHARSRELMITTELSQATRMDPGVITRVPSHHRSAERLHTKKPFYISALSKT